MIWIAAILVVAFFIVEKATEKDKKSAGKSSGKSKGSGEVAKLATRRVRRKLI